MNNQPWSPADLLQLSGGYWSACALHAGVKLDLFTLLAERVLTPPELARVLNADQRGVGMLLSALAALDLLEKRGEAFVATPFAQEFLSRSSPKYLGHIILHHHHLMEGWTHLDQAVRSGGPVRERSSHESDEAARESFLMGMFNLAMQLAPQIVARIDLRGRRRLLDMGGGPGTYAVHFCQHNPRLEAVVYDLPSTRSFAEQTIAKFGLSDRISFRGGDFLSEEIEGTFDVAWLSHILHSEGRDGCATILANAVRCLQPGGIILVQEFILNNRLNGPLFPALFSLNMLVGTVSGQSYSEAELLEMLTDAGIENVQRLSLELPNGAGILVGHRAGNS
jgi:SAM-dependent methyltransferase